MLRAVYLRLLFGDHYDLRYIAYATYKSFRNNWLWCVYDCMNHFNVIFAFQKYIVEPNLPDRQYWCAVTHCDRSMEQRTGQKIDSILWICLLNMALVELVRCHGNIYRAFSIYGMQVLTFICTYAFCGQLQFTMCAMCATCIVSNFLPTHCSLHSK